MDINQARSDYTTIATTLKAERVKRDKFLAEPRRSQALKEIDDAMAALQRLGQIINAANQAGLIETVYAQAPLLDLPKQQTY